MSNIKFSMLSRNFVFDAEDKNSFDIGFRGLKDHPQFFVCKSEVFFFKWSLITTPSKDTPNFIFAIKQGGLEKTLEVHNSLIAQLV